MLFLKSDSHLKFNALSKCIYTNKSDHLTDHINRQSVDSCAKDFRVDYIHLTTLTHALTIITTSWVVVLS